MASAALQCCHLLSPLARQASAAAACVAAVTRNMAQTAMLGIVVLGGLFGGFGLWEFRRPFD